MAPNPDRHEKGAPLEQSYLVTAEEIAACPLVAKLVVISSAWSTYQREPVDNCSLPTAFIAAGMFSLVIKGAPYYFTINQDKV